MAQVIGPVVQQYGRIQLWTILQQRPSATLPEYGVSVLDDRNPARSLFLGTIPTAQERLPEVLAWIHHFLARQYASLEQLRRQIRTSPNTDEQAQLTYHLHQQEDHYALLLRAVSELEANQQPSQER
jgi:hypothetical protein